MDKIDSRTLPVAALNERRRRAVKLRLDGVPLKDVAVQCEVFYLPSYSPELNPDEMANADLKHAVTKLAPARTKLQLVKATSHHLRSVQRQPDRIKSYFQLLPVRYAA